MERMFRHFLYGAATGLVILEMTNGYTTIFSGIVHSGLSIAQGAALYEMTKGRHSMRALLSSRRTDTES